MHAFLGCLLVTMALVPSAVDASPSAADFDGLARLVQNTKDAIAHPTGTAIAVIRDGRIVYEGYFGYADIARRIPVESDTAFYIASATKPFLALNTLLQQHRGTIDAAATLQAMFPAVVFDGIDASAVTVRHLLSHTSGIENQPLVWATAFSGIHDAESRYALVAQSYPDEDAARGTFKYSNVGYNIVSVWLERTLGTPWQRQLDETIFTPLGMTRTTAHVSKAKAEGWPLAKPYSFMRADRNTPLYLEKSDGTMHAAGGLVATAPDLARFLIAQMPSLALEHTQALPASVIARSHIQQAVTDGKGFEDFQRTGYAWGWYIGDYKGKRMLHHFGGFAGFHAHLSFIPEANAGLVVLNNEDVLAARVTNLIADYAYGVLLREERVDARVSARFDALLEKARGLDAIVAQQQNTIRSRTWNLSLPMEAYTGTYSHPLLGDMTVTLDAHAEPVIRWGRLASTATAYDGKDHMRVEWVPNSGHVLVFAVEDGKATAVRFERMTFTRTQ